MTQGTDDQNRLIFISYSHEDTPLKNQLVTHLKALENQECCRLWVDNRIKPGEEWNEEIEKGLNTAHMIILLLTPDFLASGFIMKKEVPIAMQRRKEENVIVLPVLFRQCAWETNGAINSLQVWPDGESPLCDMAKKKRDNQLAQLVTVIKDTYLTEAPGPPSSSIRVSTSKLPVSGEFLIGRKAELKRLNEAWKKKTKRIVTLIAFGGVGKTALVNHWLAKMAKANYKDAKRVYGWSFYSQGAEEGKQASADLFIHETLAWFGDPNPEAGSAAEKGRRLARLVSRQKTLLILDGLEPLQNPPGPDDAMTGRLKDRGMGVFLRELAASGGFCGLCLISSRLGLTDLAAQKGDLLLELPLSHLSAEAGVELLKELGVLGGAGELSEAVLEYGGHALALNLLGGFLQKAYGGDIRRRDCIPRLTRNRQTENHAWRVMAAYEAWLGDSVERDLLYLLGLFDRPVSRRVLGVLVEGEPIGGLTEQVKPLAEADWGFALSHLAQVGLLSESVSHFETIDCHPLVREYFGTRLRGQNRDAWQEAHRRLFNYYKNLPEKEQPDTIEEMEPLFAAVAHGCRAGLYQEALDEVFWKRILRNETEAFLVSKLGAFGSFISVLSNFFESPWSTPASAFSEAQKAVILSWSAFGLRAVGRLREAIQPMEAGMKIQAGQEDWENAAIAASNLSELLLTLGEVSGAVFVARQGLTFADRSGDWQMKFIIRTTLADALFQSGGNGEADGLFREAEALQKEEQPEYTYLYSVQGYQFCDLLLAAGAVQEVRERAEKGLEIAKRNNWLLAIALDHLTLGRAWMVPAEPGDKADYDKALEFLDTAVEGLRKYGSNQHLPRGLIYRAHCHRLLRRFDLAERDLAEALEMAQLGDMKLFLVDYHLERARLCLAQNLPAEAKKHRDNAAQLIKKTGYKRRLTELEGLNWDGQDGEG